MTSTQLHLNSERLASAAHEALLAGDAKQARALFADAARAEAQAFDAVPDGRPRTLGILAVSTTALWFKAGELLTAERFADRACSIAALPTFAQRELSELREAIRQARVPHEEGVQEDGTDFAHR